MSRPSLGVTGLVASVASSVVLVATVGSADAARSRTALVRPGIGIGKVWLGMSVAQVRRALGPAQLVNRRVRVGFGRSYVEYAWDNGWWLVGFQGRRGRLRVVRIATLSPRERTRERLGIGSRVRAVLARYPHATCRRVGPFLGNGDTQLVVRHATGTLTVFSLPLDERPGAMRIDEIIVKQPVREFGIVGIKDCPANWRTLWGT
jgi:hypothetical protein